MRDNDIVTLIYNIDTIRQPACLAVNSITVDSNAFLLNCSAADRASDSMATPS